MPTAKYAAGGCAVAVGIQDPVVQDDAGRESTCINPQSPYSALNYPVNA